MIDEELLRRAHGLLKELLDLEPEERRHRLDEACAGDERLRDEVESLLANRAKAEGFLEEPAEKPDLDSRSFVGQQVDDYVLEERLGVGAMGTVFRAKELDPPRPVALKLMNPGTVDQGSLRRFQTEIRILARLDHAGIARLYASGSWDAGFGGVPWYTMEWIQGSRRLTDYAREEQLDLHHRLDLFDQVCDAIQHGHLCGVLHRDLKPSNILVDTEGRPRVIDFGVACFLDAEHTTAHRTTFAGIVGTVGYMSPEQLQEGGGQADVRSDVYALGVILYELLTESHPHDLQETSLVQAIRIVREGIPRRPSALRPELRGDLEAILLKATDCDRERRYQSVEALRQDLTRFRDHEPVRASPPSLLREARYLVRRHRTLFVSGLTTFAVLLVSAVVSTVLALRLSDEVRRRESAQETVERERDAQARNAYRANVMAAEGFWRAGEMVSMRARLGQTQPEHRDWEWHFLRRLAEPAEWVMRAHSGRVRGVQYSHDGKRVASVDERGRLIVSWPGTDRFRVLQVFEAEAAALDWSSDDRWIAVASGTGEVARIDVNGWEVTARARPHQGHVAAVLHDDPEHLVSAGWDGTIRRWAWNGGGVKTLAEGLGRVHDVNRSHDGSLLAAAGGAGVVLVLDPVEGGVRGRLEHPDPLSVVFDPESSSVWIGTTSGHVERWTIEGERLLSAQIHRQDVRDLVVHPSGDTLLSCAGDHSAALLTLPELLVKARYRGHEETIQSVDWSPAGETIVTSSWDGTVQTISRTRLEDARALRGHEHQVHRLAWSRDGELLASSSDGGSVVLWDFPRRQLLWRGVEHAGSVRALSFRADGEVLASGGLDGRLQLWDVDSGKPLETKRADLGRVYAVEFLDDGRLLVAGEDGRVQLYDREFEGIEQTFAGHQGRIWSLDVDPVRPQFATASMDGTVRLWSLEDGSCRVLEGHTDGVYCVAFSSEGVLASGGRDQRLCLWDGRTGELLADNRTHGQFVTGLDWRPDGTRLVTGSWFETLKIWDPKPLQELLTIHDDPTPIREVRFSPDGEWILSGGGDGQIRLWDGRR